MTSLPGNIAADVIKIKLFPDRIHSNINSSTFPSRVEQWFTTSHHLTSPWPQFIRIVTNKTKRCFILRHSNLLWIRRIFLYIWSELKFQNSSKTWLSSKVVNIISDDDDGMVGVKIINHSACLWLPFSANLDWPNYVSSSVATTILLLSSAAVSAACSNYPSIPHQLLSSWSSSLGVPIDVGSGGKSQGGDRDESEGWIIISSINASPISNIFKFKLFCNGFMTWCFLENEIFCFVYFEWTF